MLLGGCCALFEGVRKNVVQASSHLSFVLPFVFVVLCSSVRVLLRLAVEGGFFFNRLQKTTWNVK